VVGNLPEITLNDSTEIIDLKTYYSDNQQRNDHKVLEIDVGPLREPTKFDVYHVLLHKQLKFFEGGHHWMFYAGNERVADQEMIDGQLGLKYIGDNGDCVYVGLVTENTWTPT
jgi:hypothetical protein